MHSYHLFLGLGLVYSQSSPIRPQFGPHPQPCKWSWKALVEPPFAWDVLGCAPKARCKAHLHKWRKCWPHRAEGRTETLAVEDDAEAPLAEVEVARPRPQELAVAEKAAGEAAVQAKAEEEAAEEEATMAAEEEAALAAAEEIHSTTDAAVAEAAVQSEAAAETDATAGAEAKVATQLQLVATTTILALLAGIFVRARWAGRRAAKQAADGQSQAKAKHKPKHKPKSKPKKKATAEVAKAEQVRLAAEAEAEAEADAGRVAEEAARSAETAETEAREQPKVKWMLEAQTAADREAEAAATRKAAAIKIPSGAAPTPEEAKGPRVASQRSKPAEHQPPAKEPAAWGARNKGGASPAVKPAAPRTAAVRAPPSSPHAKYEEVVREALRLPFAVGRLRFEQFLLHLPQPSPSTFTWMRATLVRLAGAEAETGSAGGRSVAEVSK